MLEADLARYQSIYETVGEIQTEMQRIMQKYAGVFRTDALLQEGVGNLDALYQELSKIKLHDASNCFNTEYIEILELENLLQNHLPNEFIKFR